MGQAATMENLSGLERLQLADSYFGALDAGPADSPASAKSSRKARYMFVQSHSVLLHLYRSTNDPLIISL